MLEALSRSASCSGSFYGIRIGAWPLIIANAITLVLAGAVLAMKIRIEATGRRWVTCSGASPCGGTLNRLCSRRADSRPGSEARLLSWAWPLRNQL